MIDCPPLLARLVRIHGSAEVRLSQIVAKLFPELEALLLAKRASFEDPMRLTVLKSCLVARSVEAACQICLRVCGGVWTRAYSGGRTDLVSSSLSAPRSKSSLKLAWLLWPFVLGSMSIASELVRGREACGGGPPSLLGGHSELEPREIPVTPLSYAHLS